MLDINMAFLPISLQVHSIRAVLFPNFMNCWLFAQLPRPWTYFVPYCVQEASHHPPVPTNTTSTAAYAAVAAKMSLYSVKKCASARATIATHATVVERVATRLERLTIIVIGMRRAMSPAKAIPTRPKYAWVVLSSSRLSAVLCRLCLSKFRAEAEQISWSNLARSELSQSSRCPAHSWTARSCTSDQSFCVGW